MRPSIALFAACAALLATAGAAHAAPPLEIPFTPMQLGQGAIPLPEGIVVEGETAQLMFGPGGAAGQPCEVVVSEGMLAPSGDGTCPLLWAMTEPHRVEARLGANGKTFDVAFAPNVKSAPTRLALAKNAIQIAAGFPEDVGEIAVLQFEGDPSSPRPARWLMVPLEDGHFALDAVTAAAATRLAGRFHAYGAGPDGVAWDWQVGAAGGNPQPAAAPATDNPTPSDSGGSDETLHALPPGTPIPPELACPPKNLPNQDMIVVCVDATGPQLTYHMFPEGTRLTKPNRYFYVHVVHRTGHHPTMDLGGQIGSWVPGSRGHIDVQADGGGLNLGGNEPTITLTSTSRTFAPRRPGFAPLVIKLLDDKARLLADPLAIEFFIDETFSGAFRVGIGGIFLGGVEQRHHAVTHANSLQPEIEVSGRNLMDVDLMVGYSPYLDAGGRAATGCEHAPFCFNPYFGIGILSVDTASGGGGLDWLKSVHLGVEWEISPAFAVALTANLRRVQRLADGLHPGDPIEGDIPTESRYVFGVGLVVNLSPAFFKIGAGGAAALLH